jgi:hypothetical protein
MGLLSSRSGDRGREAREGKNVQKILGKMKLIVTLPVDPMNPRTVSRLLTNMAITNVENRMTELSMMNLPKGISVSTGEG